MPRANITFYGKEEFIQATHGMTESVKRSIERKMLNAAASKIVSEVKKRTPRSRITGTSSGWSNQLKERRAGAKDALRRSLNKNPSSKWDSAARARAAGILGITVRHLYPKARGARGKPIGPHAHLVEYGHRGVFWGRPGGRVAARPYFHDGVRAAKPQVKSIARAKGKQAIEKARQKVASKVKGRAV